MSSNDENVRVESDSKYGHGAVAPGKQVIFPGDLNRLSRAPAHMPGTPVTRASVDVGGHVTTRLTPLPQTVDNSQVLQIKKLREDAVLPALGTANSAGYDLATPEAVSFKPGERKKIPLGFACAIPDHLHGRIESRSGLALKGLVVLTGVADADYRGELMVIMQNFSDKTHEFAAGDRVAQLVLRPTVHVPVTVVDALEDTARGSGGFGSTGA